MVFQEPLGSKPRLYRTPSVPTHLPTHLCKNRSGAGGAAGGRVPCCSPVTGPAAGRHLAARTTHTQNPASRGPGAPPTTELRHTRTRKRNREIKEQCIWRHETCQVEQEGRLESSPLSGRERPECIRARKPSAGVFCGGLRDGPGGQAGAADGRDVPSTLSHSAPHTAFLGDWGHLGLLRGAPASGSPLSPERGDGCRLR